MKDGAEFVGETFIFGVSVALVVAEYTRSQNSALKKAEAQREKHRQETAALNAKLHALDIRLKAVENVVEQNAASILVLGGPKYVKPPSEELVPIIGDDDEIDTAPPQPQKAKESKEAEEKTTSENDVLEDNQKVSSEANVLEEGTRSTQASPSSENEQTNSKRPWWKIW